MNWMKRLRQSTMTVVLMKRLELRHVGDLIRGKHLFGISLLCLNYSPLSPLGSIGARDWKIRN